MSILTPATRSQLVDLAQKAEALHEEARKENNPDKYWEASNAFRELASIVYPLLDANISLIQTADYQLLSLWFNYSEYHYHESRVATYKIENRQESWDLTMLLAEEKELMYHIDRAISAINVLEIPKGSYLEIMKNDFLYFKLSQECSKQELLAFQAIRKSYFDDALDHFHETQTFKKQIDELIANQQMNLRNKRIGKGNSIVTNINIAQMIIQGMITNDPDISDETLKRVFQLEFECLDLIDQAININPSAKDLMRMQQQIEQNLKNFLSGHKEKWLQLLIDLPEHIKLKKIMAKTDLDHFKEQKAKLELENDRLKLFLLTGGFWLVFFGSIMYALLQVATANISAYRFLLILFAAPIFMTILGAFILKTTDNLKEENFIKLISLALRINLKGLKALGKNKDASK